MYRIPNTEVDHLHCHTRAYLKSIGKIPIIYQIPRSQASQIRTQPYDDDDTLTYNIDDLMIDTIYHIHQPITVIAHPKTFKDP